MAVVEGVAVLGSAMDDNLWADIGRVYKVSYRPFQDTNECIIQHSTCMLLTLTLR